MTVQDTEAMRRAYPAMLAALKAIRKEARKGKPDPDKIHALADDAILIAEGRN